MLKILHINISPLQR